MDGQTDTAATQTARPYGLLGLVLSLAAAALLMGAIAGLIIAVGLLGYAAFFGWEALQAGRALLQAARAGRNMAEIELIVYVLGAVIYIAAALALILVARFRAGCRWRELLAWNPWVPWRSGWLYWALVVGALVYGFAADFVLSQVYPQSQNWFPAPVGIANQALSLILVAVLAPLAEEMLFRGWIYTNLRSRWSFPVTMIVTGALFAGAHWDSTHLYSLVVFPIGLLLGYIRERTGSMKATATLHASFNFCSWLITFIGGS